MSVALPHSYHANQLGLDPSRIHMVPEWPGLGRGRANPMEPSAITHGEMLASTIFGPEEEIASHVGAWRDVFARAKPDVVIADYAPGAVLAARGHLPLVNIGDGYTLPPADLANFPRLWPGGGELLHDEAEMARRISAALARFGAPPLTSYPDLNRASAQATLTIPAFDPYRAVRREGWLGAGPFTPPNLPSENRRGLFVSLHEDRQFDTPLMEAIAESGAGGMVVIPNMLRKTRKMFEATGFETPEELQPLDRVLERYGGLLHAGGMGTAIAAAAKGVPQVVVYVDLEKYLTGQALEERGAGISLNRRSLTKPQLIDAIRRLLGLRSFAAGAKELQRENETLLGRSALADLADMAEAVLQGRAWVPA